VNVCVPVPEGVGSPVYLHRGLDELLVEGQVLALALRRAGAEGDGGDGVGGEQGGGVAVGDARNVGLDVGVRSERHARPEAGGVGASREAPAPEVLGGGVVAEDPAQRVPLHGGGVPRQGLELGDHRLAAERGLLLLLLLLQQRRRRRLLLRHGVVVPRDRPRPAAPVSSSTCEARQKDRHPDKE